MENAMLTPSPPSRDGSADAVAGDSAVALRIGDADPSAVDEWAYPALATDDTDPYFREGRPLDMCPHGHLNRAGDYCIVCD